MTTSSLHPPTSPLSEGSPLQVIDINAELFAGTPSAPNVTPLPAELLQAEVPPYRLGAHDLLYITVWDYPELTAPGGTEHEGGANIRQIDARGILFFPFVGQLRAEGLTTLQLRNLLTSKLTRFISEPQVDVRLAQSRSHRVVLGGDFLDESTLMLSQQPLSLREGLIRARYEPAPGDALQLLRDDQAFELDPATALSAEANTLYLQADDSLILTRQRPRPASVVGEVVHPISLQAVGLSLMEALQAAGGLRQESADPSAIWVLRSVDDASLGYRLDAGDPRRLMFAEQFKLQPGDVILVGATGRARWSRAVTNLLKNRGGATPP
ncbi:MAG: hypothetical protein GX071_15260 [Gammaproteobacteria bacterium]|nr:hypothetical protein [Gammaproteobacteria bacterium]